MAKNYPPRYKVLELAKRLISNNKFVESVIAAKAGSMKTIKRIARARKVRLAGKEADEKFNRSRSKGLNIDQLIASCPRNIRENAIRDKVTITGLKLNKAKNKIFSKSLTYDNTSGRQKIRLHKHVVEKLFTDNEPENVKFSKARRILVMCDCLSGDTKVLTDKGWKTLFEIAEPLIDGHTPINYMIGGKSYPGSAPYFKGISSVWTITLSNGQEINVTKNHRFLKQKEVKYYPIFTRLNGIRKYSHVEKNILSKRTWSKVKNLKIGDKLIIDNYDVQPILKNKDFYEAFFIGVLMGDGSLFGNKKEHLRKPDLQLYKYDRLEIVEFLKQSGTVDKVTPLNTRDGIRVKFNARAMELMYRYKYVNKKSVFIKNKQQLLGYLSGLIVTDGSVLSDVVTIYGAYEYLNQINDYLVEYGYTSTKLWLNSPKGNLTNYQERKKDLWTISISRKSLNFLNENIWLTKVKQDKLYQLLNRPEVLGKEPSVKIIGIKYGGKLPVYDITVPDKKRFIINGGLISHNCDWHKYTCEYALTKKWGASRILYSNGEFPVDKNPNLSAQICKHQFVLLRYIKINKL